jgi:hypothetical protein
MMALQPLFKPKTDPVNFYLRTHLKIPYLRCMIVDAIVARATRIFKPLPKLRKEKTEIRKEKLK